MKKQTSVKPGQKRLTQFFTVKPSSLSQDKKESHQTNGNKTDDNPLNNKCVGSGSNKPSSLENKSGSLSHNDKPTAYSTQETESKNCSSTKLVQKNIYDFSPSKENILRDKEKLQGDCQVITNGKRYTGKKTPTKNKQRTSPQKNTLHFSSPRKFVEINSKSNQMPTVSANNDLNSESISDLTNDRLELKLEVDKNTLTPSKKRKFGGCLLKEKENNVQSSLIVSEVSEAPKIGNGNSTVWNDEVDFINLCNDSIIISPKKIHVKKRKLIDSDSLPNSKCSLNFDQNTNASKCKTFLEQDLSSYFLSDFSIDEKRKLAFDKLNRYEVIEVSRIDDSVKLTLKNISDDTTGVCIVKSPWSEFPLSAKDIVSIKGTKKEEGWVVDWNGLLVINPDKLISGTTIVGSVYCMRKSVLSHLFKEPGGTKDCMVIGSFVHELFQTVLRERLNSLEKIEIAYEKMIHNRNFLLSLFLANMNFEETVITIQSYIHHIHKFMQQYVFGEPDKIKPENWRGQIVEVEDIEENIWSPILGVKGKVDATVEVKLNKKNKVMPLELKTGKVSFSIEHRGQVILYCMLLQQLGRNVDSGLLLYLNSGIEIKEIKCEERETRDLTLLRNALSHWLLKMSKVETNEVIECPTLPPPINRKSCASCPLLVPCSAALKKDGLEKLTEKHHLKEYGPEAIKHLSENHINFIFHWLGLLLLEKSSSSSNMSDIWSVDTELREKSGKCLAHMRMDECNKDTDGRYIAVLSKIDGSLLETEFTDGQLLVISTESHFAHALGVVKSLSPISITLMLDKYFITEKPIFLDAYEGDSTFTILTNSLSCLLENSPRAALLRDLIIDLKIPSFSSKLSSKIKKIGDDIFNRLNREQVRAVLQAIAAENYILIKGMPGTGKTTTMAAMIELLARLKMRVLVTSFTHSAIDNILINLVGKVKMLRLGPEHRIHEKLKPFSEQYFLKTLKDVTPAAVEEIFSSREVVGVTCFGSKHAWIERQTFDVCLIDEATQVPLPGILKPIAVAKKFVLIGDPKQLPPLVINKQARDLGLGKSLFERLERPAVTSPLTLQYRMNRVITSLANDFIYNGILKCANDNVEQATLCIPKGLDESLPLWLKTTLSTEILKSVIILDVKNNNVCDLGENKSEADVVKKITEALMQGGVLSESIGVIATYNRQVTLLKSLLLESIEVNTVDQYQGRDKDIIIYSTTRTSASAEKSDILSDWNRLTVGITRAKKKLIIIGNLSVLKEYSNFKKLITSVSVDNIIRI